MVPAYYLAAAAALSIIMVAAFREQHQAVTAAAE
jgi:hypothetical protein